MRSLSEANVLIGEQGVIDEVRRLFGAFWVGGAQHCADSFKLEVKKRFRTRLPDGKRSSVFVLTPIDRNVVLCEFRLQGKGMRVAPDLAKRGRQLVEFNDSVGNTLCVNLFSAD